MASSKLEVWNLALANIGHTKHIDDEESRTPEATLLRLGWDTWLQEMFEARRWPWARRQRPIVEVGEQVSTVLYADAVSPYDTFSVPYAFLDNSQLAVVHIGASGTRTELDLTDGYTVTAAVEGTNASITLVTPLIASESVEMTVTTTRVGWDYLYALPADCVTPIGILYSDGRYAHLPVASRGWWEKLINDSGDGYFLATDFAAADMDALEYIALIEHVPSFPSLFVTALSWRLSIALARGIKKDEQLAISAEGHYLRWLSEASANANNVGEEPDPITPSIAVRG